MIKTVKRILVSLGLFSLLVAPVMVPAVASAQNVESGVGCGATLDPSKIGTDDPCITEDSTTGTERIADIVELGINIFSWIVGVIAVVMIIVGGLKYITSGGESGNISGAKNTILFAVVGLIVVALAQFLVQFVLEKALNSN